MALFDNFAEFQPCVAVNNSFEDFDYMPFTERAAKRFVYPYLSKAMYDALLANRANNAYTPLLKIVQRAVANYAMYLATPRIATQASAQGFLQSFGEGQKTAKPEQVDDIQADFLDAGHEAIEEMLEFLFANRTDTKYTLWTRSDAYTRYQSLIVNTYQKFTKYLPMSVNFAVFFTAYAAIRHVELRILRPILGKTLYNKLVNSASATNDVVVRITNGQSATQAPTAYAILLDEYILPLVGVAALRQLLKSMTVIVNRHGTITQFDNTTNSEGRGYKPADKNTLELLDAELGDLYDEYLLALTPFLEANAADYPEYSVAELLLEPADIGPFVI